MFWLRNKKNNFLVCTLNQSPDVIKGQFYKGIRPSGHNLNKLGRAPLGDATYQLSRLEAL